MENINSSPSEPNESPESEADISIPENVFLIFQGVKVFPLNQPVISIGRSHENTIVIDDPRISRRHLEIRVVQDHFVVFDLHSTGGTYINGQRINQGLLYSGDQISLAGVSLVFMHDTILTGRGNTDPNPSIGPGVHSTVVLNSSMTEKYRRDVKKRYP